MYLLNLLRVALYSVALVSSFHWKSFTLSNSHCRRSRVIRHLGKTSDGISAGIDLGTTNSAICVLKEGVPSLVPIFGNRLLPSAVTYHRNGSVDVGEYSKLSRFLNPRNTFLSTKRVIGRKLSSLSEVKADLTFLKVDKSSKDNENCVLKCDNVNATISPEDVASEVLRTLLSAAQEYCGEKISRAVIGVPAYFMPDQCEATERAGFKAGLDKVIILKEPEAAALAYGVTTNESQIVMVNRIT